ncbi:TPA: 16S rRNA (cytosine(1402)-N(4))-methyltransferase RsmH [Candidatus Saccharibacteria bacterium]|nr:16S rRNA (cytosine(1402)-N(4))-methyltransferase RsmH [Candidatus Saccharibacteria bacterium]HIO87577.1 16S rRNA (cytosine(1402)-N(4))-methyltransferase RsmH [Candidatus Saccharibacteria bacterium]
METHHNPHTPVLCKQVVTLLEPQKEQSYLDLTAGYGGHASEILDSTWAWNQTTLVDRDAQAIKHLENRFYEHKDLLRFVHADMVTALQALIDESRQFDMILADLGISSVHVDQADRGFSFMRNGPLDMRMDPRQDLTAAIVVNTWSEVDLLQILREYGEERQAKRIVQAIMAHRPIRTTEELADVVSTVVHRKGKKHPATRTFQALRIAVNDEVGQLKTMLQLVPKVVSPGGRVAIISFHSLEDRLVKQAFKDLTSLGIESDFTLLTTKPVTATEDDINPRARSAKLRAVAKIKQTGDKKPK